MNMMPFKLLYNLKYQKLNILCELGENEAGLKS